MIDPEVQAALEAYNNIKTKAHKTIMAQISSALKALDDVVASAEAAYGIEMTEATEAYDKTLADALQTLQNAKTLSARNHPQSKPRAHRQKETSFVYTAPKKLQRTSELDSTLKTPSQRLPPTYPKPS